MVSRQSAGYYDLNADARQPYQQPSVKQSNSDAVAKAKKAIAAVLGTIGFIGFALALVIAQPVLDSTGAGVGPEAVDAMVTKGLIVLVGGLSVTLMAVSSLLLARKTGSRIVAVLVMVAVFCACAGGMQMDRAIEDQKTGPVHETLTYVERLTGSGCSRTSRHRTECGGDSYATYESTDADGDAVSIPLTTSTDWFMPELSEGDKLEAGYCPNTGILDFDPSCLDDRDIDSLSAERVARNA